MKNPVVAVALYVLLAAPALAEELADADAERLRTEVASITASFERGDAEALIERTHHSLHELAGGRDAFAEVTRQSVAQLRESGVKFLHGEVGTPTQIFKAGDEKEAKDVRLVQEECPAADRPGF